MIPLLVKELRDALYSRWLAAYALALGLLGALSAIAGLRSAAGLGLQAFGRTTATLTNLCLLLAPLVSLVMGALAVAGERERGTLDNLMAQPIARHELLLGKYLGLFLALGAATWLGFAPAALAVASVHGWTASLPLLGFPLLAILLIASQLALGLAVSVRSRSAAQALGSAIALWFLFVLLYDLLVITLLVGSGLGAAGLATLLVLNPVDASRVLVVLSLEADLYLLGPAGALLVDTFGVGGTRLLLSASLLAWTAIPLGLALCWFRLRKGRDVSHRTCTRRTVARRLVAALILALLTLAACAPGEEGATRRAAPTAVAVTPELLARGKAAYQSNCVPCHGPGGRGDGPSAATLDPRPRDHTDPQLMAGLSDRRIADTIRMGGIISGFPNMPASPHLRGEELVAVVAYVRSLHQPEVSTVDLEGGGQDGTP